MIRRLVFLSILLFFLSEPSSANEKGIPDCHAHIQPLHIERERVAELDGIWGLFEKNRSLQGSSVIAIDLDKKINSIILEIKEGMKHGRGCYVWNDGSCYDGEWFENKINGEG